jgi:cell division inhibitor SulA
MVGMAVATTVDSIEARNRLSMMPMVTRMIRLCDIRSFQDKWVKVLQSYFKIERDWQKNQSLNIHKINNLQSHQKE